MFTRKIVITDDGSSSIKIENRGEQYHSKYGAIQEAMHVFIKNGLQQVQLKHKNIDILELGFGTGLNSFLTLGYAHREKLNIRYTGIEKYPLSEDEWRALNYFETVENATEFVKEYRQIFSCKWESFRTITSYFSLKKQRIDFFEVPCDQTYHLIYFDAFAFHFQPDMWSEKMFKRLYRLTKPGGILVTYSAKGSVRRLMQKVGFAVERLIGPPGKREMLRAQKTN